MTDKHQPPAVPERIWIDPQDSTFWNDTDDVKSLIPYARVHPDDARVAGIRDRVRGYREYDGDLVGPPPSLLNDIDYLLSLLPQLSSSVKDGEAERLTDEVALLRAALKPFVSRVSLFRRHQSDKSDLFECPFCHRRHADWTQIPHDMMLCPVAAAQVVLKCGELAAIAHTTALAESSERRCGECDSCHHSGPLNAEGYCMVDISPYVDPGGPCHNQKECFCKCVFPATGEGGQGTATTAAAREIAQKQRDQLGDLSFDAIHAIISRRFPAEATRRYFCSCGGALTAEEYIDHYFVRGHDRGDPAFKSGSLQKEGKSSPDVG